MTVQEEPPIGDVRVQLERKRADGTPIRVHVGIDAVTDAPVRLTAEWLSVSHGCHYHGMVLVLMSDPSGRFGSRGPASITHCVRLAPSRAWRSA